MIPSKFYDTSGCDSTSSNCVVWQGPDLDCINVCDGDTISIVLAKMAERLCTLTSQDCTLELDISSILLKCLEEYIAANSLSDPQTIQELMQIIIDKLCEMDENMTEESCCNQFIPLPECLQFTSETTGQVITQMTIIEYVQYLATQICSVAEAAGLPGQTPWGLGLEKRVRMLERTSKTTTYTTPQITPKYIGRNAGKKTGIDTVISDVEKDYGQFKSAVGGTTAIRDAAKKQPLNLSGSVRLNGTGVYNTMAGWTNNPTNLTESFGNAWLTIGDMRTAIVDLQAVSAPKTCDGISYDFEMSFKDTASVVNGIKLDFRSCVIPANFSECHKAKGCKIIVKDSSFNQIIDYCFPTQLQTSDVGHTIKNFGELDLTSNFEITVEFCFTDGSSQCAKTMTKTLQNSVLCPTITTSSISSDGFSYSVSGINTNLKSTVTVIIEDSAGNEIQSTPYTSPSSTINGSITGLNSGSSYSVFTKFTSTSGNVTTCDRTGVTTSTPTCSVAHKATTDFTSTYADFRAGATKIVLSCYNDGVNTTEVIGGFDTNNNFIVYKGTAGGGTCTAGSLVTYGTFISDNPTQQLTCNSINYAATGITTSMTTSGWQYVDTLTSPQGTPHYIYALVDASSNAVVEVVSCCDCKSIYLRDKGFASTNEPNKVYYVGAGSTRMITIDAVGYLGTTEPKWNITRSPSVGTITYESTSADKKTATYKYTAPSASTTWTSDSFQISVTNSCGTSNTLTVPILRAQKIPRVDTDINIFVDTTAILYATASTIKTSLEAVKSSLQKVCPTWTGTFNYIPINGSTAGDWGKCVKALVDMKAGATGSVTVDSSGSWSGYKSLPAYWDVASTKSIPTSAFNIVFTNQGNTNGTYGSASLTTGWATPTQPTDSGGVGTDKYEQDYDGILDVLEYNAGTKSAWATAKSVNCTIFPSGFAQIIIPIVTGPQDESAATVLQTAGAILGETVSIEKLDGLSTGNIKYPINLKNYLLTGTAPVPVPYTGTTSGAGRTMVGLQQHGFTMASFFENGDDFSTTQFQNLVLSMFGTVSTEKGRNCPQAADSAKNMVGPSGEFKYADNGVCADACTEADATPVGIFEVYNSTGTRFDTSVRAFTSKQGVLANIADPAVRVDELTHGAWYATYDGTNDGTRKVAQYSNLGAPYWSGEKVCSSC